MGAMGVIREKDLTRGGGIAGLVVSSARSSYHQCHHNLGPPHAESPFPRRVRSALRSRCSCLPVHFFSELLPAPMPVHTNGHDSNPGLSPNPDDVLDKLRDLVSEKYSQQDTAAMHIRSMALIGRLKSLYRAANTATRITKEDTAAARHDMDQSHLNLQNLLYEKRHLEREIEKCRQFA